MRFSAPKGTTDILPDMAKKWQYLERKASDLFELYEYDPVITPIFEHTDVFQRAIGTSTDIVQKEMYTFEDKGGRNLTLRPEGTAPVIRAYVDNNMNQLPQPLKLYYVGPMFRYERPQAGRFRQFFQIGVEAIGSDDPAIDAETILLMINYFKSVGLKELTLYINSMGCENDRPKYIETLRQYAVAHEQELCKDCRKRVELNPLRLFDCKDESCQRIMGNAPKITEYLDQDCTDHFNAVRNYLDMQDVKYIVKPELVRGLDYYTKTTFEVVSPLLGAQNAIGGGGRYNKLVEEFGGPPTPGIGFAIGLERLTIAVEKEGAFVAMEEKADVFIAVADEAVKDSAVSILYALRGARIAADIDYTGRSLKGQLKYANKKGFRYTVFLGPQELERGVVQVKDMKTSEQHDIKLEELVRWLGKEVQNSETRSRNPEYVSRESGS